MHAGAERALEVVVDHYRDLRLWIAPHWPARKLDVRHVAGIRILSEIQNGDIQQLAAIFSQQEIERLGG